MKIAHTPFLLTEGLLALGAELYPLPRDNTITLKEALNTFETQFGCPDLVLIEFLGVFPWKIDALDCILDYPVPIVVYAADSTINIYYYKYLLKFFDYVFVDQHASVQELMQHGIIAHWLPLCVPERFFREKRPKNHVISFVGRSTPQRFKRNHLLSKVQQAFPSHEHFYHTDGVSYAQMQDIFAASHATLNENLFNGLTWRVLQALAAGTLLLTETGMDGLDVYFKDGEHLLCYTPQNLIPLCRDILKEPDKFQAIAQRGQELCHKKHTSKVRAEELFQHLFPEQPSIKNLSTLPHKSLVKKSFFHEKYKEILPHSFKEKILLDTAVCAYTFAEVHGGNVTYIIITLESLVHTSQNNLIQAKAAALLAYIFSATTKKIHSEKLFLHSLVHIHTLLQKSTNLKTEEDRAYLLTLHGLETKVLCQLCIFYVQEKNYPAAIKTKNSVLQIADKIFHYRPTELFVKHLRHAHSLELRSEKHIDTNIYFSIAQVYAHMGNIFELGYNKQIDSLPNTALTLGLLAWRKTQHSKILDFILPHLMHYGLAGYILPELLDLIKDKKATQSQQEQILHIAKANYCFT